MGADGFSMPRHGRRRGEPMAGMRVSLRARHQPSGTGPPSRPRSRLCPGRLDCVVSACRPEPWMTRPGLVSTERTDPSVDVLVTSSVHHCRCRHCRRSRPRGGVPTAARGGFWAGDSGGAADRGQRQFLDARGERRGRSSLGHTVTAAGSDRPAFLGQAAAAGRADFGDRSSVAGRSAPTTPAGVALPASCSVHLVELKRSSPERAPGACLAER